MKYVLDVSAALCWVIPRPLTPQALQLRADHRNAIHDLLAPSLFVAEVASALSKCERQKLIPVGDARQLFPKVLSTSPLLHAYQPLLDRAFDISASTRSGLFDCLYVALAEREGCPLVTADDRLVRNLQPHFSFLVSLSTLP